MVSEAILELSFGHEGNPAEAEARAPVLPATVVEAVLGQSCLFGLVDRLQGVLVGEHPNGFLRPVLGLQGGPLHLVRDLIDTLHGLPLSALSILLCGFFAAGFSFGQPAIASDVGGRGAGPDTYP